jgi:hypothetical protein
VSSLFFTLNDLNEVSHINRAYQKLFKPIHALRQLLNLVVRHELSEKLVNDAINVSKHPIGIHPIHKQIHSLLVQNPSLALKKDYIIDHDGRKRYWSPLEAAFWLGNWEICNILFYVTRSAGLGSAAETQLRKWRQQAYNYDIRIIYVEAGVLPNKVLLEDMPALIKEAGSDKLFLWGNLNGEWSMTELEEDAIRVFSNVFLSDVCPDKHTTLASDEISFEMYEVLKKGHTVARFDLNEYIKVTTEFAIKWPIDGHMHKDQYGKCDNDSFKIGKTQRKFPAWLAGIWCSDTSFKQPIDFENLIRQPEACYLKLYQGLHFFDKELGYEFSVVKNAWKFLAAKGYYPSQAARGSAAVGANYWGFVDVNAMICLNKLIVEKLNKFVLLVEMEAQSTQRCAQK